MTSKHSYNVLHRDSEMVGRLRKVLLGVYDQQIAEIEELASSDVTTPYRVDPKSRNAGADFLTQTSKLSYAKAARTEEISKRIRLCEVILDVCITPRNRTESDEADQTHTDDSTRAAELLAAARGSLNPEQLKGLRTQYGDAFNVPMPAGSDPEDE